jgi:hypothetical protein
MASKKGSKKFYKSLLIVVAATSFTLFAYMIARERAKKNKIKETSKESLL